MLEHMEHMTGNMQKSLGNTARSLMLDKSILTLQYNLGYVTMPKK